MKESVAVLFITLCLSVFGQKKEITFGKVSEEEMKMMQYEQDPEAEAVILFDKGESIFFDTPEGYDIRFTRHKRIKIFNKTATAHTEISIPYYVDGYGKTERVESIEAYTYNIKDGRIFRKTVQPSTIYDEQINSRWKNKKFTFPDVQDGSVLEVKYVVETPFHFNLPDWSFQDKIPTIYSEYQVSMIPFYEYIFMVQGTSKFDYQNSEISKSKREFGTVTKNYGQNLGSGFEFQDYVHTYVMKDVPAFRDESYITSINDYIMKMDFQLSKFHSPRGGSRDIISTWPALNEALLKHESFGKYQKACSKIARDVLEELIQDNEPDRVKQIIEYVRDNFEWNGFHSKYASQSAKEFYKTKTGNSADINLFLIAMLNEAGIETTPVILSTRGHGKIPNSYPFDHFTNYVIALVNSPQQLLADGTNNLLPHNRLPIKCMNEKGLVVNEEKDVQWVSLENNIASIEKKSLTLKLDSITHNLRVNLSIQSTEYESFGNRQNFKNDTTEIIKYYTEKVGTIDHVKTFNYEKFQLPYSMFLVSSYETEKLGDNIVFKPFLNLPMAENPLTQKQRSYPVDFIYPWDNQFQTILNIPDNYTISDLPEDYEMDNDLANITLKYHLVDGQLKVQGNYQFKKSVYDSKEYARIKYYLNEIVSKFNQPIVLEKS